jgi:hypothetical protein
VVFLPAGNGQSGTRSRVLARSGKGCVADGGASRNGGPELDNGNVVVRSAAVVARVNDNGSNSRGSTAGVLVLQKE